MFDNKFTFFTVLRYGDSNSTEPSKSIIVLYYAYTHKCFNITQLISNKHNLHWTLVQYAQYSNQIHINITLYNWSCRVRNSLSYSIGTVLLVCQWILCSCSTIQMRRDMFFTYRLFSTLYYTMLFTWTEIF